MGVVATVTIASNKSLSEALIAPSCRGLTFTPSDPPAPPPLPLPLLLLLLLERALPLLLLLCAMVVGMLVSRMVHPRVVR